MHLLCPDDAPVTDEMIQALRSSEQLVLELDMDAPDFAKRTRRASQLPMGVSLRRLLKQREFNVLKQFFRERLNQSIWAYVSVYPVLTESVVYSTALSCTPVSYELKLMELAKAQSKEVEGLETVEWQMASLQRATPKQQAKSLVRAVLAYDSIPPLMQQLVTTYRQQNVDALYRMATDPRLGTNQAETADLAVRNQDWIPKMKTWMAARPSFFAVGAAHLGGATGVLQLLRQQGYKIEPVVVPLRP
ncbi:hypothetical protein GCM10023186_13040 [Hymenobacter koreensis]|uniref:TraB/GumN family protein n=2 Tax=Hymenobacter koreensis TaxID=1084523 RepID=A0ABP8IWS6_9BACT